MRLRIEGVCRSLQRRAEVQVTAWRGMLEGIDADPSDRFADWFAIERRDGRDTDVGMHRHWIDPTLPFTAAVGSHSHGLPVTPAPPPAATGDPAAAWSAAEARTGAVQPLVAAVRSPVPAAFDSPRDH